MDQRAAFHELVMARLDSLYNYARLLASSEPEAEDLLQETLLHAFRAFASFNRDLSFAAWVHKIMRNAHIDRLRRLRTHPEGAGLPWESGVPEAAQEVLPYPVPVSPEEIVARRIAIEKVRAAMARLPAPLREVVELREIQGLSYREIAAVIQAPIGTVMSRLYRGRNLLRSLLLEGGQEPAANGREAAPPRVKAATAHGL